MKSSVMILNEFIESIHAASAADKETAMLELITERLDTCLNAYIALLNKDLRYLNNRNQLNIIRKMKR